MSDVRFDRSKGPRNGRFRARAGAAFVAVPVTVLGVLLQDAGQVPAGSAEGEPDRLARYRDAAEDSDRPIDQYNFGTALLLEGQVTEAQGPLQQALQADDGLVRLSGYYNFGLSTALDGKFGQSESSARRAALLAARDAFREVLRGAPEDEDARWNLELINRWLEEEDQSGGQGSQGGQSESPGGAGAGGSPSGGGGQDQMLSPEEAAALLEQAGEAEASIRDRVMGRNRFRDPVVEKNW